MNPLKSVLHRTSPAFAPILIASCLLACRCFGTLASDDFDSYGNTNQNLNGLSGGTGWAADSAYAATGVPPYCDGGVNLVYFLSGYVNSGAADGFSGSAFNNNSTAVAGTDYVQRAFSQSTFTSNTTLWVSALVAYSTAGANSVAFLMFNNGGARIGVQAGKLALANGSGTIVAQSSGTFAAKTTHLIIFRMDLNTSGNDTITGWIDPVNVSSQGNLGTPAFTYSADILGTSVLNNVRIGLRGNAGGDYISMDAIRISYGPAASLSEVITGP
jgi:hypothetical protein